MKRYARRLRRRTLARIATGSILAQAGFLRSHPEGCLSDPLKPICHVRCGQAASMDTMKRYARRRARIWCPLETSSHPVRQLVVKRPCQKYSYRLIDGCPRVHAGRCTQTDMPRSLRPSSIYGYDEALRETSSENMVPPGEWNAQTSNFGENCDRVNSSAGRVSEGSLGRMFEWPSDSISGHQQRCGDLVPLCQACIIPYNLAG
jgi:hypothetical protein